MWGQPFLESTLAMGIERTKSRADLLNRIAHALKEAEAGGIAKPESLLVKLLLLRRQYKIWKMSNRP